MSLFINILRLASHCIPRERIKYRKYKGKEVLRNGVVTIKYEDYIDTTAFVQPGIISSFGGKNIEERNYKEMGLDWSKRYITVWAEINVHTSIDKHSPDQLLIRNKQYDILMVADWIEFNGWKRIYAVERSES